MEQEKTLTEQMMVMKRYPARTRMMYCGEKMVRCWPDFDEPTYESYFVQSSIEVYKSRCIRRPFLGSTTK